MTVIIRPAQAVDEASVRALLAARDHRAYDTHPRRPLLPELDATQGRLFLATEDNTVLGMSGLLERWLEYGRKAWRAGYWVDLFVDPEHKHRAIYPRLVAAMLEHARATGIELIYTATRRRRVWQAHLQLGFHLVNVLPVYARPISPLRLGAHMAKQGRLLPVAAGLDRLLRAGRGWLRRPPRQYRIETGTFDEATVASVLAIRDRFTRGRLRQGTSVPAYLRRHQQNLDRAPYVPLLARREGEVVAFATYRLADRDRGIRAAVLMDVGWLPGHSGALPELVRQIEEDSVADGAEILIALAGTEECDGLLQGHGFLASPETYVLLVWPAPGAAPAEIWRAGHWAFSFTDHDAF
jgi:GNAT superfamily N-acetyltransferase